MILNTCTPTERLAFSLRSYDLTYEKYCTHDRALQKTARFLDSVGINATSDSALLPNAGILRGAEAFDSVANAIESGKQETSVESGGFLLCSVVRFYSSNQTTIRRHGSRLMLRSIRQVQLGGLLYVLFVVTLALFLLSFLSIFNWIFLVIYDSSVAVATAANPNIQKRSRRSRRAQTQPQPQRQLPQATPLPAKPPLPQAIPLPKPSLPQAVPIPQAPPPAPAPAPNAESYLEKYDKDFILRRGWNLMRGGNQELNAVRRQGLRKLFDGPFAAFNTERATRLLLWLDSKLTTEDALTKKAQNDPNLNQEIFAAISDLMAKMDVNRDDQITEDEFKTYFAQRLDANDELVKFNREQGLAQPKSFQVTPVARPTQPTQPTQPPPSIPQPPQALIERKELQDQLDRGWAFFSNGASSVGRDGLRTLVQGPYARENQERLTRLLLWLDARMTPESTKGQPQSVARLIPYVNDLLRKMDTDRNNQISEDEFKAYLSSRLESNKQLCVKAREDNGPTPRSFQTSMPLSRDHVLLMMQMLQTHGMHLTGETVHVGGRGGWLTRLVRHLGSNASYTRADERDSDDSESSDDEMQSHRSPWV